MKFEAMEVIFLDASMNETVFGRKVARSVAQGFSPHFDRMDNEKNMRGRTSFLFQAVERAELYYLSVSM